MTGIEQQWGVRCCCDTFSSCTQAANDVVCRFLRNVAFGPTSTNAYVRAFRRTLASVKDGLCVWFKPTRSIASVAESSLLQENIGLAVVLYCVSDSHNEWHSHS